MKAAIDERFRANLARARNLVALYQEATGGLKGRSSVHEADLLRAAVILLHASLEDLLRSLAEWKLPAAAPDALEAIPLVGAKSPRKTPFDLADLAAHRGRSVDDVIADSVKAWLARSNYNNVVEVVHSLEKLGVDPSIVARRGALLDAMMSRRHLIAHRADRNDNIGPGQHAARSLGKTSVERWIAAVEEIGTDLLAAV